MEWRFCAVLVLISVTGVVCQTGGYTTGSSGTTQGNSQGACVFPFTYKGVSYQRCTTINNKNKPWCSLTSDFGSGGRWANCQMTCNATRTLRNTGNAGGSFCVFPFKYLGRMYYTCMTVDAQPNSPWCATSDNYDRDERWGKCVIYPYIRTVGGNAGSQPCMFPFFYTRRWVHGCLIANRGKYAWCATSRNYDTDKLWGRCIIETITGQTGCNNNYAVTANVNTFGGTPQSGVTTVDACKSACNANGACLGLDWDGNAGADPKCYLHFSFPGTAVSNGVNQHRIITRTCTGPSGTPGSGGSVVTVLRGNAPPDRTQCVFPFWASDNRQHGSCISQNWYTPWCSLSGDYRVDRLWGECTNIKTDARN